MGVALTACGPVGFTTEIKGQGTVTGGTGLGGVLTMFPQLSTLTNIDFDQSQDFKNNNTSRDHVTSVLLKSMTLKISSPNDQDFSFLDTIQFVAKTGENEAVFAEKSNISKLGLKAPNPVLTLNSTNVDLAPFVRASTMSIVMRGTGRQPPQDTRVEVITVFNVFVKL